MLSMEQAAASKRQIFSNAEGYKMLCNELLGIIKRQDPTLFADSVGDDVHQWDVWMSNFDPSSQLAKVRGRGWGGWGRLRPVRQSSACDRLVACSGASRARHLVGARTQRPPRLAPTRRPGHGRGVAPPRLQHAAAALHLHARAAPLLPAAARGAVGARRVGRQLYGAAQVARAWRVVPT